MTVEEFTAKQESMSNEALIGFAEEQVSALAKTGGKSHRMCVPPQITDTDMLSSELIKRFKKANESGLKATSLIAHLKDQYGFNDVEQKTFDEIIEVFGYNDVF